MEALIFGFVNKSQTHLCVVMIVMQIWEAVDNPQGYLARTGLYKALALTALAQQGKSINDKILESYSDQGKTASDGSLTQNWILS